LNPQQPSGNSRGKGLCPLERIQPKKEHPNKDRNPYKSALYDTVIVACIDFNDSDTQTLSLD
jgi:hypothetical protein